jgi:hypothetical protein
MNVLTLIVVAVLLAAAFASTSAGATLLQSAERAAGITPTATSGQESLATAQAASVLSSAQVSAQIAAASGGRGVSGTTAVIAEVGTGATIVAGIVGGPVAAAAVSKLVKAAEMIFHGADPSQVPASIIEQAYEAAADNLYYLFIKAHMLTRDICIQGINALGQGCQQAEQTAAQAGTVSSQALRRALANAGSVIAAEASGAAAEADAATTQVVDLAKARTYYTQLQKGWYATAISNANALTDAFVSNLPQGVRL